MSWKRMLKGWARLRRPWKLGIDKVKELQRRLRFTQDKVRELQCKLRFAQEHYAAARTFYPVYRQGQFAQAVGTIGEALKADCYISLLPSSLPAAFELQRRFGGTVFCDNVENVEVDRHSIAPRWSPVATQMVNDMAWGGMRRCDGLITIGNALASTLEGTGRPVLVLKNFREFAAPVGDGSLRKRFGLDEDAVLLFTSGNVVLGFEPVLEALSRLPQKFHLVALVQVKPKEYEEAVLQRMATLGLQDRVHFSPFVDYDELAKLAADADIGLIVSDITNPNGSVGLPNRCFDYLTAGLPVVAPAMPDVRDLVETHGFGRIVLSSTPDEWHRAILAIAEQRDHYRKKAEAARRSLTWESQERAMFEFLGQPRSVTLIGLRDLSRYQRYLRLSRSLHRFHCTVKAASFSENPDPKRLVADVEYYFTADRYGVGTGLVRFQEMREALEVA